MGSSLSTPVSSLKAAQQQQPQQKRLSKSESSPPRPLWLLQLSPASTLHKTLCDAAAAPPPPPPLPPTVGGGGSTTSTPLPPPPPPETSTTTTASSKSAPPPPPTTSKEEDDSIAKAAATASAIQNPGPYEQASLDSRRLVMLDTFDGFRCDINKQLSPFMLVVHNFQLGFTEDNQAAAAAAAMSGQPPPPATSKSTYSFVGQVADEQGVFVTRYDAARQAIDGRLQRMILGGVGMAKLQLGGVLPSLERSGAAASAEQQQQEGSNDQLLAELDFGGQTWTGNVKYGSMGGQPIYGCNYFQALTPRVALGGEGMYVGASQQSPLMSNYTLKFQIPAKTGDEDMDAAASTTSPESAAITAAAAPTTDLQGSSTFCLNYNTGQGAATVNYARVVTPRRVTLAAELSFSPMSLESNLLLGAEFQLSKSKLQFCVDGTGRIQSLLETKLGGATAGGGGGGAAGGGGGPKLQFSSDVNHFKEEMKFGFGLSIDG